jgi:predicted nucleic acid-binding protein
VTVCVDASLIVRYLTVEPGTAAATAWFEAHESEEMIAPAFVAAEVATALLKKARRGEISDQHRDEALAIMARLDIRLSCDNALVQRAVEVARELDQHAVYDSLYLALAESQQCEFWTADARFARAAAARYPRVRLLG